MCLGHITVDSELAVIIVLARVDVLRRWSMSTVSNVIPSRNTCHVASGVFTEEQREFTSGLRELVATLCFGCVVLF